MKDISLMQAALNGMSQEWQRDRAVAQLTLGRLISGLRTLSPEARIFGLGKLMSYRGYYCDLAFSPTSTDESVAELLSRCEAAMGMMGETTPLWVAEYGSSGQRLMALDAQQNPVKPITAPEEA